MAATDLHGLRQSLEFALLTVDGAAVDELWAESGLSSADFCDKVATQVLQRIGAGWEQGDVSMSQVYMAARLIEDRLTSAEPLPIRPGSPVIGVGVFCDFHALGKRVVASVLRSARYDVRDMGSGLSIEGVLDAVRQHQLDVVMLSVLMYNRALQLGALRAALDGLGPKRPSLVVGGAPFVMDPTLGSRLGIERWGRTAADALAFAQEACKDAACPG